MIRRWRYAFRAADFSLVGGWRNLLLRRSLFRGKPTSAECLRRTRSASYGNERGRQLSHAMLLSRVTSQFQCPSLRIRGWSVLPRFHRYARTDRRYCMGAALLRRRAARLVATRSGRLRECQGAPAAHSRTPRQCRAPGDDWRGDRRRSGTQCRRAAATKSASKLSSPWFTSRPPGDASPHASFLIMKRPAGFSTANAARVKNFEIEASQIHRIHPNIPAATMMGIGLMWDFQKRIAHAAVIA